MLGCAVYEEDNPLVGAWTVRSITSQPMAPEQTTAFLCVFRSCVNRASNPPFHVLLIPRRMSPTFKNAAQT